MTDTCPGPSYPLPRPDETDPRFTYGLAFEIAEVLIRHGYPQPAGTDWAELMASLHRFLYGGSR